MGCHLKDLKVNRKELALAGGKCMRAFADTIQTMWSKMWSLNWWGVCKGLAHLRASWLGNQPGAAQGQGSGAAASLCCRACSLSAPSSVWGRTLLHRCVAELGKIWGQQEQWSDPHNLGWAAWDDPCRVRSASSLFPSAGWVAVPPAWDSLGTDPYSKVIHQQSDNAIPSCGITTVFWKRKTKNYSSCI